VFPTQVSHRRQRRDENAPPRSITPILRTPIHGSLRRVLRLTNGSLDARSAAFSNTGASSCSPLLVLLRPLLRPSIPLLCRSAL
ncbi:hypothetical protein BD311DRAFT_672077, partial [Dichomitus squalens]